ncbi:unnamed protein product [Psylliodes chrysocephalus]|uniref:Uncharacterized protein n=1 Tax=Psylliodes chrysocephalus TaxID=3402493 RepID=A0A9P0CUK7_9CUCU|nr:unnamed protein product [Psylliodes chrysocephala]
MRQTKDGNLILRTDGRHMAANMLKETLAKGLHENEIVVKKDTTTRIIHIMGMYGITTKEEVIEALKTVLNGKDNFIVRSLRSAYAKTQNTTLEVGQEEAADEQMNQLKSLITEDNLLTENALDQGFVTESEVDLVVKSSGLVPPTEHILADSDIENSEPNKERDDDYKPGASEDHTNHNLVSNAEGTLEEISVRKRKKRQHVNPDGWKKIKNKLNKQCGKTYFEWQPLPFIRVPRDMPIWKYNELPMMYLAPIPIKAEKYQHLMALKTSIGKDYHPFYDALKHL